MEAIDQAEFYFSQRAGVAVAVMVGFLVFAVALDLTWAQFRRVFKRPAAPGVGLIAQFCILPAVAFAIGRLMVETPSVAIGLLLVACCPGGALSNYLTGVAKGDVATSISMTAVSTVVCIVVTPLLFAVWVSMNPATSEVIRSIDVDPARLVLMLMIMLVIPVAGGMGLRAFRPRETEKLRVWVRRLAMLVFAIMVTLVLGSNFGLIVDYSVVALAPVLATFAIAGILGWALARASRLAATERRAVVFEVAMQNVALAIAIAVAFFPGLVGVAVTSALWGAVHITLGLALAAAWKRIPLDRPAAIGALRETQ